MRGEEIESDLDSVDVLTAKDHWRVELVYYFLDFDTPESEA